MSEIITDKLTGKTSAGDVTITSEGGSATMQLQQGVAKAWINLNGTGTPAANDSFNVASITDTGVGYYEVTFTSNMSNTSTAVSGMRSANTDNGYFTRCDVQSGRTTSMVELSSALYTTSLSDGTDVMGIIHGDLAYCRHHHSKAHISGIDCAGLKKTLIRISQTTVLSMRTALTSAPRYSFQTLTGWLVHCRAASYRLCGSTMS